MCLTPYYEILQPIDSGRHGTVYKVIDVRTKELRAVKLLPRKRQDVSRHYTMQMEKNEISGMTALIGHPNVVRLHEVTRDIDFTYLVQEYCDGGTLHDMMKLNMDSCSITKPGMPHALKIQALSNMVAAIAACHSAGILFCDLKPANILFSSKSGGVFKLTDFGASQPVAKGRAAMIMCTTPLFAAPELFTEGFASLAFDVWGLGILAYLLFLNKHPFFEPGDSMFTPLAIPRKRALLRLPETTPPDVADFIERALSLRAEERPLAAELMTHPLLLPS